MNFGKKSDYFILWHAVQINTWSVSDGSADLTDRHFLEQNSTVRFLDLHRMSKKSCWCFSEP